MNQKNIVEVVLPKRVIPQPTPMLYDGGDCGACVLGGLTGLSIQKIYDEYMGSVSPFTYWDMESALVSVESDGLLKETLTHHPSWSVEGYQQVWGATSWSQALDWFKYMYMAFEAGYYGLATIHNPKGGPFSYGPNHWVLLCGARKIYPETSGEIKQEILISCSSRSTPNEQWVSVEEFLKNWGGFNVMLAKPVE